MWMEGELSQTYYDCYKLAFDVAKRAEQTLKRELMRPEFDELDIIKFGYWDGGRKGLLAGETLTLDLKRLEMAYLEQNRREFEMTRTCRSHGSTRSRCSSSRRPGAARSRCRSGSSTCDSPGHYMRRLKGVGVSIPCVDRAVHGRPLHAVAPAQQRPRVVARRRPVRARRDRRGRPLPRLRGRDPVDRHEQRAERHRPVRAERPRRPLPAVRGRRRDRHVAGSSCPTTCRSSTSRPSPTWSCTCATRRARPATCGPTPRHT